MATQWRAALVSERPSRGARGIILVVTESATKLVTKLVTELVTKLVTKLVTELFTELFTELVLCESDGSAHGTLITSLRLKAGLIPKSHKNRVV